MPEIALNLVVLRSSDCERAAAFYARLGLQFERHRHGKGREHFAAELNGCVFELYPLATNGAPTHDVRIGFGVNSVDEVLEALSDTPAVIATPAHNSEWGRRAVVVDPDGHKIEIVELNADSKVSLVETKGTSDETHGDKV